MITRGSTQDKIPRPGKEIAKSSHFLHDRMKFAKPSFAFFRIQFAKFCENATDGHPCIKSTCILVSLSSSTFNNLIITVSGHFCIVFTSTNQVLLKGF